MFCEVKMESSIMQMFAFVCLHVIIITYPLHASLFFFPMFVLGCVHWGVCMEKPALYISNSSPKCGAHLNIEASLENYFFVFIKRPPTKNLCSKYRPSCTDCTGHHPPISNLSLYVMPPTGLYTMVSYDAIFQTKVL